MDEPVATTEESKQINAIDREAVHRICSGQVVLDLAVAVKELVENSLDSGATSVEVKLIDHGQTCITVIDNGSGVLEKDFEGLGLKHHTSKLREFSDLLEVGTFGFRGEALSSLCSLSNLSIITRHSTSECAFELQFDKNGILIEKKQCARQVGTTVTVKNIFKNIPVRAKEFGKNIKKEFAKMIQILYSYCLVSTGIKINCTNSVGNKPRVIVSTNGLSDVMDNITSIFGRKVKDNLIEVELQAPDKDILNEYNLKDVSVDFTWKCYVSSCAHTVGRSAPDRQFFYVNGRPCDPTKIIKLVNFLYHKYNNKQYPFIYFNIEMNKSCADVNVTPDKRTILFSQERIILACIKANLDRTWKNTQGTFTVNTLEDMGYKIHKRSILESPENSPPSKRPFSQKFSNDTNGDKKICTVMEDIKRKLGKFKSEKENVTVRENEVAVTEETIEADDADTDETESKEESVDIFKEENNEQSFISENGHASFVSEREEGNVEEQTVARRKIPDVDVMISLESVKTLMKKLEGMKRAKRKTEGRVKYKTKLDSKNVDVEKELERELTTESFRKMQIIGQFNLGFILTRLEDDLFIVDQHASDEKFRFEKLSNETKLKTQKLILPKPLNLAVLNETTLIENQHVFEANGFTFCVKDEEDPSNRVNLTGIPVSYGWQFGQEDIEEILFLIREGGADGSGTKNIPRPTRIRQMLASRACRGAVMVGDALNCAEMRRLITQMSQMEHPWNCPHGRPTLRHLLSMAYLKR